MEFLLQANRVALGGRDTGWLDQIVATGKHVVIIGGGDTGADCLGTSTRQAASITQLEIMPNSSTRPSNQPWPSYPMTFRCLGAQEAASACTPCRPRNSLATSPATSGAAPGRRGFEGGKFHRDRGHRARDPGGAGAARDGLHRSREGRADRSARCRPRPARQRGDKSYMSSVPGVFVAGDAGRGQSLIVWAIAEGVRRPPGWTASSPDPRPCPCRSLPPSGRSSSDTGVTLLER